MGMGRTGGSSRRSGAAALLLVAAVALSGCGQGGGAGAGGGSQEPAPPPATLTDGPPPGGPTSPTEDGMDPDGEASTGPQAPPPPSPAGAGLPDDPAGAELVLVVDGPGGPQPPVTLSCDFTAGTATGTHPLADQACTDLLAALQAGDPFAPVPPDALCTQQFGGEAVVELSGAVLAADGGPADVQATFTLTDGCQISRWEQLGAVLAPYRGDV